MERPIPAGDEWVVVARQPVARPRPATCPPWVRLVWPAAWAVDMLCALRFEIRLLGTPTVVPFAGLVHSISDPLVAPFRAIFPETAAGRYVLEPSAVAAALVYTLLAIGVVVLFRIGAARRRRPAGFE